MTIFMSKQFGVQYAGFLERRIGFDAHALAPFKIWAMWMNLTGTPMRSAGSSTLFAPLFAAYRNALLTVDCVANTFLAKGAAMSTQSISTRFRRFVHRNEPLQLGLLLAFWLAGKSLVKLAGLPVLAALLGCSRSCCCLQRGG